MVVVVCSDEETGISSKVIQECSNSVLEEREGMISGHQVEKRSLRDSDRKRTNNTITISAQIATRRVSQEDNLFFGGLGSGRFCDIFS